MKGKVYWLTGLSGAGKTTIGRLLSKQLKAEKHHTVFLDGDEMRAMLGVDGAYTYSERKQLSFTYSRLCNMLAEQGIDVICATISMFEDVRLWNKNNIENYREVYIKCPAQVLMERDCKGIYQKLSNKELLDVAGFDLEVEEPKTPDLIITNDGKSTPEQLVNLIHELN